MTASTPEIALSDEAQGGHQSDTLAAAELIPAPAGLYRIAKSFSVEAAHQLGGLPDNHKCGRVHGHSYAVEVIIASGCLVGPGFVIDFGELDPLKQHLAQTFDHRLLNDVLAVQPTSENVARVIWEWCAAELPLSHGAFVEAVRVSETATTWAEYHAGAPMQHRPVIPELHGPGLPEPDKRGTS